MEFLPAVLPNSYRYIVIEDTFTDLSNFCCKLRIALANEAEFNSWFDEFKKNTNTSWIVNQSRSSYNKSTTKKFVFCRRYVCHHSKHRKKENSKKSKNCTAFISVRIKRNNKHVRYRDKYVKEGLHAEISIKSVHTHDIECVEAWNWLKRDGDTVSKFFQYFADGYSVTAARKYHSDLVAIEHGPEFLLNSRINPPKAWAYKLHRIWLKQEHGTEKRDISRLMEERKKRYEPQGNRISVRESPLSVAVVTPIMERTLRSFSHAIPVFVDSWHPTDQPNSSFTMFLAPTKVGAIPIGACIHESRLEYSYTSAFQLLSEIWRECSFDESLISSFVMYDNRAIFKKSLNSVWPNVRKLLSQFCAIQAVWRWLLNCSKIQKENRMEYMRRFKGMMYSTSEYLCGMHFLNITAHPSIEWLYKKYIIEWYNRKDEWVLCYRENFLDEDYNNYVEITFRMIKDIILTRLKGFSATGLMDFLLNVVDKYYKQRLLDVVFNRFQKYHLLHENMRDKATELLNNDKNIFTAVGNGLYDVILKGKTYKVHSSIGFCTCRSGIEGAFCKHQAVVHLTFNIPLPGAPVLLEEERKEFLFIAMGENQYLGNVEVMIDDPQDILSIHMNSENQDIGNVQIMTGKNQDAENMYVTSDNRDISMTVIPTEVDVSFSLSDDCDPLDTSYIQSTICEQLCTEYSVSLSDNAETTLEQYENIASCTLSIEDSNVQPSVSTLSRNSQNNLDLCQKFALHVLPILESNKEDENLHVTFNKFIDKLSNITTAEDLSLFFLNGVMDAKHTNVEHAPVVIKNEN